MAAKKAPAKAKEVFTGDLQMQQPSAIVMPATGPIVRENEEIAVIDSPITKDYADALAFNEDVLTIMLQPSSEENAPTLVDVYNNGEAKWVQVGVATNIKRKFVEDLIRAKPISIQTTHDEVGAKVVNNRVIRTQRAKYPLSIMHDPNPKGGAWLNRIMAEL